MVPPGFPPPIVSWKGLDKLDLRKMSGPLHKQNTPMRNLNPAGVHDQGLVLSLWRRSVVPTSSGGHKLPLDANLLAEFNQVVVHQPASSLQPVPPAQAGPRGRVQQ